MYVECKRAPTHHCFTCQGLAQCMAAAGVTRLAALLAWDRGTQPGATYYRIQNQHNPAVISEKDLINDKCEPKTERRHGKCGQGDQSPFKFGYSPLQVFQLSLIRARHHHCSRSTKLANSPPISSEVFRPNRRVRPVTASISSPVSARMALNTEGGIWFHAAITSPLRLEASATA
jgi:hypothetical protein